MELSIKQKTFIAEYLKDGNATRSAITAGYSFSCDIKGYYVYLLVDPRNGKIFYVGKGKGDRVLHHERLVKKGRVDNPFKCNIISDILKSGNEVSHYIFESNLSESDAYTLEKNVINGVGIDKLTNIDTGQLGEKDKIIETAKFWLEQVMDFNLWKEIRKPSEKEIALYHFTVNGFKALIAGDKYA